MLVYYTVLGTEKYINAVLLNQLKHAIFELLFDATKLTKMVNLHARGHWSRVVN